MKSIQEINLKNKIRAICAIVFSVLLVALIYVGVTMRLFDRSELTGNEGLATYRMFTVDSNVLIATCALLCIPYQVDGIINNNFHLPRWIVYVLYVGTTAVSMTFLVAVAILSPIEGFKEMLLDRSNLFLHLICPFLAIILFIFVEHDHKVKFKHSYVALIPILIYAMVYSIMAFAITEKNGGWRDHYRFNVYMPWPVTAILLLSVAYGIATGLRVGHNKIHLSFKRNVQKGYLECEELKGCTLDEIMRKIARENRKVARKNRNIIVPTRLSNLFIENNETKFTNEELCKIYVEEYLKFDDKENRVE